MYSTTVIEKAVAKYEESAKHKLARIDPARVESWIAHLDKRLKDLGSEEAFWSAATREERLFIRNERVMSMLDFRYWAERYCRSEEHTSELQSHGDLVCRLLLEKKK